MIQVLWEVHDHMHLLPFLCNFSPTIGKWIHLFKMSSSKNNLIIQIRRYHQAVLIQDIWNNNSLEKATPWYQRHYQFANGPKYSWYMVVSNMLMRSLYIETNGFISIAFYNCPNFDTNWVFKFLKDDLLHLRII